MVGLPAPPRHRRRRPTRRPTVDGRGRRRAHPGRRRRRSTCASPARRPASSRRWPPSATGRYALDGAPRMRERPDGRPRRRAARRSVRQVSGDRLPFTIDADGLAGGRGRGGGRRVQPVRLGPAAGGAGHGRRPASCGSRSAPVSRPYLDAHRRRDAGLRRPRHRRPTTARSRWRPAATGPPTFAVEPDASAASYFFAAAAICGGTVRVPGLGPALAPGRPRASSSVLARMGADGGADRRRHDGDRRRARSTASRSTWPTCPTRRRPSPSWPRSPSTPDARHRHRLHPGQGERSRRRRRARAAPPRRRRRRGGRRLRRAARARSTRPASTPTTTTAWR